MSNTFFSSTSLAILEIIKQKGKDATELLRYPHSLSTCLRGKRERERVLAMTSCSIHEIPTLILLTAYEGLYGP
jgi:hypothetical protein